MPSSHEELQQLRPRGPSASRHHVQRQVTRSVDKANRCRAQVEYVPNHRHIAAFRPMSEFASIRVNVLVVKDNVKRIHASMVHPLERIEPRPGEELNKLQGRAIRLGVGKGDVQGKSSRAVNELKGGGMGFENFLDNLVDRFGTKD